MGQDLYVQFNYNRFRAKPAEEEEKLESMAWKEEDELNAVQADKKRKLDSQDCCSMLQISYSLGSGHAWQCYIRQFVIAAYRECTDIGIKRALVEIAPPRYPNLADTRVINYTSIEEISDNKHPSLYWIQEMAHLDSNGRMITKTPAQDCKPMIHKLQSLIPYLATKSKDLIDTPYIFDMNGDMADERTVQVVHYLTKALRYDATIVL